MRNLKILIACVIIELLLTSCSEKPAAEEHAATASKLYYIKDKHGICYTALDNMTYPAYTVTTITAVNCAQVGL